VVGRDQPGVNSGSASHLSYQAFVPTGPATLPPLVLVHGWGRASAAHFQAFLPQAMRVDLPLIVPRFPVDRFRRYQTLGGADGPLSALRALDATLDDASRSLGLATDVVSLFGFSGGAQFAHRYAMLAPHRVDGLVVAAAGWYTFLDPTQGFPRGSAPSRWSGGRPVDGEAFLRRRVHVLVGARDVQRDEHLRVGPRLDRQQGEHRLARAGRWVEHLNAEAGRRGIDHPASCELMPGTGHSFGTAVRSGGLVEKVLAFLTPVLSAGTDSGKQLS
jgi:pimeloyl-ACP methyl ester carboxylesterase